MNAKVRVEIEGTARHEAGVGNAQVGIAHFQHLALHGKPGPVAHHRNLVAVAEVVSDTREVFQRRGATIRLPTAVGGLEARRVLQRGRLEDRGVGRRNGDPPPPRPQWLPPPWFR